MSMQEKERLSLEEVANCATHGVGLALSVAGLVALVALAWAYGDAWHVASCGVYGASLVALYLASTLYHGARALRHLPAHRGDVHAFHARYLTRAVGLDAVRAGVGAGAGGHPLPRPLR